MKPKCFLFLVLLDFGGVGLTVSSIDESNVRSYDVERRISYSDLFVVHVKYGTDCANSTGLSTWCKALNAYQASGNGSYCSCRCNWDFHSFLPLVKKCIKGEQLPEKFGGCPKTAYENVMNGGLAKSVNLHNGGKTTTKVSSKKYNCSLHGYYFDYSGFQVQWERVTNDVFELTIGSESQKNFIIQWKDKKRKLSGRIIYLEMNCVGLSSQSKNKICYLLKAQGNVTYYAPSTTSSESLNTVPTTVSSPNPSSMFALSTSPQLSQSMQQTFSLTLLPQPTTSPSPSPSLDATTGSPTKHTDKFSTFVSKHVETSSLQTRPVLHSAGPILPSTSTAELESSLPVSSEEISNHVINTGIPKSSASTEEPNYSEPSELPTTESSLPPVDGPGDKEARKGGKDKGVAIGAGVGGAVAFGIIVIGLFIVFCKRRRESTEKKAKLHVGVKNPGYEKPQDDIKMERPREKATTFSKQDSQPTYLELVDNKGHENYGAVYSTADENYDNSSVYQSLDNNTPAAPSVYQSLQNNQPSTKKPIPKQKQSNAKNPGKPSVPPDPVYSVLEESHIKQGNTSEAIYNVLEGPDPGQDTPGNIQDPVYNVLDGAGAGQTDEAPDVGVQQDPLYNVLEVPESKQEHQEPLYNVLENADTENAHSRQHGSSDGATSEPLYNVLDVADSSGAEYAAPNRPLSADSHDNPAYEQTLEFGAPHALVDSPGSQRESLYEPLKGSDRQDVYEPLHKKGK
ncbi:uncharacterized protein [Pocillopora verrucosa]|uniref:uncharacterized protein isoform X4 n=1 Tax=Pocillopora verrucosa TaxID=203993 RepID=UPI00333E2D7F